MRQGLTDQANPVARESRSHVGEKIRVPMRAERNTAIRAVSECF